jgi:glycosyltransferase involved in cell wall biosynthesis
VALVCAGEGGLTDSVRNMGIEASVVRYRGAPTWFLPAVWERLPASRAVGAELRRRKAQVAWTDFHSLPYVAPACRALGVPLAYLCWGWWFRPRKWQLKFYRHRPEVILAPSEAVRRGFLGSPPAVPPARVRVLHPGVDVSVFRPRPEARASLRAELGLPWQAPLITLLARFQFVKGHDVFLQMARIVSRELPETRFLIAGDNAFGGRREQAYQDRVLRSAREDPSLRERVIYLGRTDSPQRLLAASDIVVCSSRFESYGMAPLEAMACAVPVVSTNVGGPSETIVDGEVGFLVPPERPDRIADRVVLLLRDDAARRRMGARARRRVEDHFTLSQFTSGVERTIETLAAGR